jgi:ferredoxin
MKTIVLRPLNDKVVVRTETNILDTLLARKCDVAMACGGQGICATCHVFVREGSDSLTPMSAREQRTLGLITGANSSSRLACQAKVVGEGVVVEVPLGMYLQSSSDLTTLVGRRTEVPIKHPKDGRVLIERDKIITKSRILELQSENFNVLDVRGQSSSL